MKKLHILGVTLILSWLWMGTTWADPSVSQGVEGLPKVDISIDRELIKEKGLLIDGQLYVPVAPLANHKPLSYWMDMDRLKVYFFFGGNDPDRYSNMPIAIKLKSRDELAKELMQGIPYQTNEYHSGMMKQDIINIASLIKSLLETNSQMENVIYMKLSLNQETNINMLRQSFYYRSEPLMILEDRMRELAEELGDQLSSRDERKMDEVIELIEEALEDKEDAFDSIEDWIKSSDEDDLEDFKDYEEDAKDKLYEALEILTGEDFSNPGKIDEDSLKRRVEDWIAERINPN